MGSIKPLLHGSHFGKWLCPLREYPRSRRTPKPTLGRSRNISFCPWRRLYRFLQRYFEGWIGKLAIIGPAHGDRRRKDPSKSHRPTKRTLSRAGRDRVSHDQILLFHQTFRFRFRLRLPLCGAPLITITRVLHSIN